MSRLRLPVLALPLIAALSACDMQPDFNVRPDWTPMQSPKVNQVSVVNSDLVVPFAPGSARLGASEVNQIDAFISREARSGTNVSVIVNSATGPTPLAVQRGREIQSALSRRGVAASLYQGESDRLPANTVLVSVDRYTVTTPRCPDFSKSTESNYANTPDSNFGCANAQNLGVMVANPADLVRGRDLGAQDGTSAVLAMQRYRIGKVTPLANNGGKSGGTTGGSSGSN